MSEEYRTIGSHRMPDGVPSTDSDALVRLAQEVRSSRWLPATAGYRVEIKTVEDSFGDGEVLLVTATGMCGFGESATLTVSDPTTPVHSIYLAVKAMEDAYELGRRQGVGQAREKLLKFFGSILP